jgi:hypothetical protein
LECQLWYRAIAQIPIERRPIVCHSLVPYWDNGNRRVASHS